MLPNKCKCMQPGTMLSCSGHVTLRPAYRPSGIHLGCRQDVIALCITLRWPMTSLNHAYKDRTMSLLDRYPVPESQAVKLWRLVRALCVDCRRARRCRQDPAVCEPGLSDIVMSGPSLGAVNICICSCVAAQLRHHGS